MANIQEYQDLSLQERLTLIGSVVHLLQNDRDSFVTACSMVRSAHQNGVLDGVVMFPQPSDNDKPEMIG
jgi:hypothetical protein